VNYFSRCNVAIKREQTKACFQYVEREQHRRWLNLFRRFENGKLVFQFPERTCLSHFHRQRYGHFQAEPWI